jgi:quinol monooxygenase YgiN
VLVLVVEVQVKPEMRERFLEVIKEDAQHSEEREPGCHRFDVLEDLEKPNTFLYYEVYKDEAALAAHRETPHFKAYAEHVPELMAAPAVRRRCVNIHPSDADWR